MTGHKTTTLYSANAHVTQHDKFYKAKVVSYTPFALNKNHGKQTPLLVVTELLRCGGLVPDWGVACMVNKVG